MKKSMLVLIQLLLALLLAIPAFAAPPDKVDVDDEFEYTFIEDCSVYDEGWDFAVQDIEAAYGHEHIFYNKAGDVVKRQFNVSGTDTLFRADDRHNTVVANWHNNGTWNLETNNEKFRGLFWNVQLPGVGLVYHDSGAAFIVDGEFDRFAGLEHYDLEAICRYFAG